MHAEKQNQNRNTELLLCFLMLHVAAHLLGVVFRVGTDIYNYQWIQRVFRAFSKVTFKKILKVTFLRGKGLCVCFGSFLFKPFLLPVSNLLGKINR